MAQGVFLLKEYSIGFSWPHLYANKWRGSPPRFWKCVLIGSWVKIIKEQLVFPSGTATGQLISVMHRQPPPTTGGNGTLKRRAVPEGYSQLEQDETSETPVQDEEGGEIPLVRNGWTLLGGSFITSGALTVRQNNSCSAL